MKMNRCITVDSTVEDMTSYFQEEWRHIPTALAAAAGEPRET